MPVDLAGYSFGGTIVLALAVRRPDLVRSLVLISAAFHHEGMIVAPSGDGSDLPEQVVAAYAEVSPDGRDHFRVVAAKIMEGIAADPLAMTEAEVSAIAARTLVVAADDDIVHLEHTLALYRAIPDAGEVYSPCGESGQYGTDRWAADAMAAPSSSTMLSSIPPAGHSTPSSKVSRGGEGQSHRSTLTTPASSSPLRIDMPPNSQESRGPGGGSCGISVLSKRCPMVVALVPSAKRTPNRSRLSGSRPELTPVTM